VDTVLVDTNVFSYLLKNDTRAQLGRKHPDGNRLALSFMTVAELFQ
jgi:predicted nucleic acid-binding protein